MSDTEEKTKLSSLIKNEDVDPMDVANIENNPWSVEDASAFLKYCCPECDFNDWNLQSFANHALENHKGSNILFTPENSDFPNVDMFIKQEDDNYDNGDDYMDDNDRENDDPSYSPNFDIKDDDLPEKPKPRQKRKKRTVVKADTKKENDDEKEWICVICFLECASRLELRKHYEANHKNGKFKICSHCDFKEDKNWSRLCIHIDKKHPDSAEKKNFCDVCGKGFIYNHSLNYHKKTHEEKPKHVCNLCGDEYVSMQGFKDHMFIKHGVPQEIKNLVCDQCGYSAITRQHLSRHIHRKHTSHSDVPLFCEKCGFSTNSKVKLYVHNVNHHNVENHKKCPHCEYTNSKMYKIYIHIDNNHPEFGEKNFLCEKCFKTFTYEATFTAHSKYKCRFSEYKKTKGKEQYEKKKIRVKCDYCKEVFNALKSTWIKNHYRLNHPGKPIIADGHTKFCCTMCREFYFFEEELNCHLNLEHGMKTDKNYCPKCKAPYVDQHTCQIEKKYLKNGQKKDRVFPCKLCDKTYSSNAHLKGHVKTVHEKCLDFECAHCGKKVGSSVKLQNHINSCHSQVKCEICGKDIANPYDLRKHKVFVHKETKGVWLCERCPKSMFLSKATFEKHMKEKH